MSWANLDVLYILYIGVQYSSRHETESEKRAPSNRYVILIGTQRCSWRVLGGSADDENLSPRRRVYGVCCGIEIRSTEEWRVLHYRERLLY